MKALPEHMHILDFKKGDVNGDGFPQNVYLIGKKSSPDDFFSDNIALLIQNLNTNTYMKIPLRNASGYNAELYLGHFTTLDKLDILVSIDTGGSGRYISSYLYTLEQKKPVLLFDSNTFDNNSIYDATFIDKFKVTIRSRQDNSNFLIDVSTNSEIYIDAGIYDKNGTLLKSTEGGVLGLGALWPLQENYDDLTSLLALQRIIGINNADNLGAVHTYLKWDGKKFIADRVQVAILAS
jgi:hypothetical protein